MAEELLKLENIYILSKYKSKIYQKKSY